MALDKREVRDEVAPLVGDIGPRGLVTTTAAGNAAGTTYITTQFTTYGADYFRTLWALVKDGAHAGKYREIDDFDGTTPASSSTTTIKGAALGTAIAASVTIQLYKYDPVLYTIAINKAIMSCYPLIYLANMDSSITWVNNDYKYNLPVGIKPEMVQKVMVEGDGNFDETPYWNIKDFTFSPDEVEIWFNRQEISRIYEFTATRKIYIFSRKYLTALDADITQGSITTDETDKIELTKTTRAWRLFLKYCRAEMYELLGGIADNPDVDFHANKAKEAWADAHAWDNRLRMASLESTYSWF